MSTKFLTFLVYQKIISQVQIQLDSSVDEAELNENDQNWLYWIHGYLLKVFSSSFSARIWRILNFIFQRIVWNLIMMTAHMNTDIDQETCELR